jgi:hypothetical protein
MLASKHDIRVAAKERHPSAVNIRLEAKEDFKIPGVVEVDGEHPGIRVIVNADGRQYVYEADTRDELLAKLLEKREDKAGKINPADTGDEWTDEAILAALRQQVADLEETRERLKRNRETRPADDNPELMDVILELRAIRKLADNVARELGGDVPTD